MNLKTQLQRIIMVFLLGFMLAGVSLGAFRLLESPGFHESDFWGQVEAATVYVLIAIPLIAALRVDWWDLRIGAAFGAGIGVFASSFLSTGVDVVAQLGGLLFIVCLSLAPWCVGRFIWWVRRPHE